MRKCAGGGEWVGGRRRDAYQIQTSNLGQKHRQTLVCQNCLRDSGPCRWLGLHAFERVLRRKQARYRDVLSRLEEEMGAPGYAQLPVQLADVVDEQRSAVFKTIRY